MIKIKYLIILFAVFIITGCNKTKDVNVITASGTIETVNVTVSSKQPGQIKLMDIKEGDRVKDGDLLLEIDHDILDIQLRQAKTSVDYAQAQLRLLKSGARKEDIKIAQENMNQMKINLEQSKTDLDRLTPLLASGSISKKQYDDAKSRYDLLAAQYYSASENYSKLKKLTRPEEIEAANANLNKAIAGADLLQKNSFYPAVVHCSYYSCIQLMKHILLF